MIRTYNERREKYIQLSLQSTIKVFVSVCIIMEKTVICLLMVKKFVYSDQKILRL